MSAVGSVAHLVSIVIAGAWATAALLVGVDDPPWVLGTGTLRWISAVAGVAVIPIPWLSCGVRIDDTASSLDGRSRPSCT